MTLTLTPQELRDLLDGTSSSVTTRTVASTNPPDGEYNGLHPPDPSKTSPCTKQFYPEDPTMTNGTPIPTTWPATVRYDPPVDMTPHATCTPITQDYTIL